MSKKDEKSIHKNIYILYSGDDDWIGTYFSMEDLLDENDVNDMDVIAIYVLKESGHMIPSDPKYVRDKKYK